MPKQFLAACAVLAVSCVTLPAMAQTQTFTPPTIQPPQPPSKLQLPAPATPTVKPLQSPAQGLRRAADQIDRGAAAAEARAAVETDPPKKQALQANAARLRARAAQMRQRADDLEKQAAQPAAPPAPVAATPPAQHTPSPLAKAEHGLCLALTQPPPGKGGNDPALVCDCARAYGANLIKEAEELVADIDKRADDLAAVGANVLEAEGLREVKASVAKDHETLAGLRTLWAHPDDQCHAWGARAQKKAGPEQETYMARGAKSFSYNAVQMSVRLFWSFMLDDTGLQMHRISVDDNLALHAEAKQFDDHRELCPEWTQSANARVQTITSGMLVVAAQIRQAYTRFKPELLLWNKFAGRDGWPSTQYPHPTGGPGISFLEFSEPVPMDLAYHPDGKINNGGDPDYAVKLHYQILEMEIVGPNSYYCGQWSPGAPPWIERRMSQIRGINEGGLRLDPLKPVGHVEFYASGADAAQMP